MTTGSDVRAPLDCHVGFAVGSHRSLGRARDISTNDLYLYTKEPAAVGVEVLLYVILPYQLEMLELPGVVETVRPGLGMDVRFTELHPDQLRAIVDYIDTKLRRASGTRPAIDKPKTPTGTRED